MKVSLKKFWMGIAFFLTFVFVAIYIVLTDQTKLLIILPCILFVYGMMYCFNSFYDNIFLFCFLICFFTFLLSGQIINRVVQVYGYSFSDEIEMHTDIALMISLFGLLLGYILCDIIWKKYKRDYLKFNYDNIEYTNIRKLSKTIYYLTYLFWIVILLDNVLYVAQYGYTSYYISYSSRVPSVIRQIGYMAPMSLFIYLATMPDKKDAMKPIIMYSLYLLLSLGTGRRIYFMTGLLIIFAYAMLRNVINPSEKSWVSKKSILAIVIAIPVLLSLMYLFEYIRSDSYVGEASNYSPILGFFVRQGTSINVIKYAELFKNRLNSEAHYSLYNLIKWLQGSGSIINKLFSLDFDFEMGKQTALTATQGTYLADFISYFANSSSYLSGMGYGSCYIAELYVDYGYIGVLIGNFIYGILLCFLLKISIAKHNVWSTALGFYIVDLLFKAPRATFDAFLGQPLYFECWGTLLVVFCVSYFAKNRGGDCALNREYLNYRGVARLIMGGVSYA